MLSSKSLPSFLLIPDKFKGSLSALEVIAAIKQGIRTAIPDAQVQSILASDGGDGFLDSIAHYKETTRVEVHNTDQLGRPILASYLLSADRREAYIEMAQASGLVLLQPLERDPLITSTYGTGLLVADALNNGARTIYLGIGGSATNDGGTGIAQALGYQFLDKDGAILNPCGAELEKITKINPHSVLSEVTATRFIAVNDVNNPLCGQEGAAYVYAAQKGATLKEIEQLDIGLRHLDKVVQHEFGRSYATFPGAGAAGGTAYGLKAFFNASFISGIDFILQMAGADDLMHKNHIHYLITGEGKIDSQTQHGKLISGVLALGKKHRVPVVAVCGMSEADEKGSAAFDRVLEIANPSKSLEYNMEHASELLEAAIKEWLTNL